MNEALLEPPVAEPLDTVAMARCIGELPALPRALLAAVRALSEDNAPASECIDAIERDTALATRMLHLANSALYGARGYVASVGDAVQMLGLRTVASVVAAVSLRSTLVELKCEGFSFEDYWHHALTTAIVARELAQSAAQDPGEAFLAGLLHDVGELLLAMAHPERTAQALQRSREGAIDLYLAERLVIGLSHDQVGADVARHWHFPSTIINAIAYHHEPLPPEPGDALSLSSLVHLSDALAQGQHSAVRNLAALSGSEEWMRLGLPEEDLPLLFQRAEQELAAFASV